MAEACSVASLGQLAWTSDWHIRDETYASALRCLVNQQEREPFAATFGSSSVSSSDGQFFQAAGFGRDAGRLNAHYSQRSGFKIYTHLSGCYGPYFTKLIAATASEALHVLDALVYHQGDNTICRHHTDGGGDSDHVFALCTLLGFLFAPRIPDLKHRRLYSFGKPSDYPTLEPLIAGRINVELIRSHWAESFASSRPSALAPWHRRSSCGNSPHIRARMAWQRHCESLADWSARSLPSTGLRIPNCGVRPARS
jgi:TnpA family transposase